MNRQMRLEEVFTPPPDLTRQQRLTIVPLTLADAADAVEHWHRHHRKPTGHRFSIGVWDEADDLRGVAIVGRPTARAFDQRFTVETTRVATDGTPNACSALYGAVWRAAKAMGFLRALTYTQAEESGASLRAVGWRPIAELRPRSGWDTPSRRRENRGTDGVARVLWEQTATGAPEPPSIEALRNEIRNEIPCGECGEWMPLRPGRGRRARYCSTACRVRAHRAKATP